MSLFTHHSFSLGILKFFMHYNFQEVAMNKEFDQKVDNDGLVELTQAILGHIHRLPGNDRCADCNSDKGNY